MTGGRIVGLVFLLASVVVSLGTSDAWGEEPKPDTKAVFDCGTIALFHLSRWEGHPIDLGTLSSSLPPCPAEGYSMKELRDVARKWGLRLEGVQLRAGNKSPDRPALVFLKNGDHGHYVVVRPVGHTGRLVQIADLDRDPSVVEASSLYSSPSWTGMALVQDTMGPWVRAIQGVAVLGAVVSAIFLIKRRTSRSLGRTHSTTPSSVIDTPQGS